MKKKHIIIQSDPLGMITINMYSSVKEASLKTGISTTLIHDSIGGRRTYAGGYIWEGIEV